MGLSDSISAKLTMASPVTCLIFACTMTFFLEPTYWVPSSPLPSFLSLPPSYDFPVFIVSHYGEQAVSLKEVNLPESLV